MRFYSVDPAEQGASPYLFCGNNPINHIDPTGEFWHAFVPLAALTHTIYNGIQSAKAIGNPAGFLVGFNSTAIGYAGMIAGGAVSHALSAAFVVNHVAMFGYSEVLASTAAGLISQTASTIVQTGEFSSSLGPMSYDWEHNEFDFKTFDEAKGLDCFFLALDYIQLYDVAKELDYLVKKTQEFRKNIYEFFQENPRINRAPGNIWTEDTFYETTIEEAKARFGEPTLRIFRFASWKFT